MDIDNASEDRSVLIADVIIVGLFVGEDAAVANRNYEFDGVYNTEWDGGSDCPVAVAGGWFNKDDDEISGFRDRNMKRQVIESGDDI
ncbi:hypothetical protein Tco_1307695 [Tanacetum coccineum]